MKALICSAFGVIDSLVFTDIPIPVPLPDEVIINVHACGINFPDLLFIQGKYQVKPDLPFSPGGEVSGVVESVGENVTRFKAGDKVIGLCRWGGLAEKVKVRQHAVFHLPEGADFIAGASTLYAYGTSYHALKDRAQLKAGETLLVLGASGGVGLAAVELGKILGAKVIAAASADEKLKACKEKGADYFINYSREELRPQLKAITENGVDVVYDAIGGKLSEPALRSLAWSGRYLVVGFASGEIPTFPANLPLLKGCSVVGVFFSGFIEHENQKSSANFQELVNWMQSGKIKPHIHHIYSFPDSVKALKDLSERRIIGKAVIQIA